MRFSKTWFNTILRLKDATLLVFKSAPAWSLISIALILIQGVLPLALIYLTKLLVDAVTLKNANSGAVSSFQYILFLIAAMGLVGILEASCRSLVNLVNEVQSQATAKNVYDMLHAKSIEVDLEYYENPDYYDSLHRAQQETPFRPISIVNNLTGFLRSTISLSAMSFLLFSFHWSISAVLLIAVVPGIFVRMAYLRKIYDWQRQSSLAERKTDYLNQVLTSYTYAKELRLFDLGKLFANRFSVLRDKLRQEKLRLTRKQILADLILQAVGIIAIFVCLIFIASRCFYGAITAGSLVMYYQALYRGSSSLRETLGAVTNLYDDSLYMSYFHEFMELKNKVAEPVKPKPFPKPISSGIVFDSLSFGYPTGSKTVLENINLSIRPGEHIALVGENGAGKTTLIKLLCRLYEPDSGRILVDGVDLREFATKDLRYQVSAVFQDYVEYYTTARENIWFGDTSISPDDTSIYEAAQYSGANDFLNKLPKAYETMLGKLFPEGEELSVGEWQKIALARAFLRNSQILILDEPTSNLDAKTEYEIFSRFHLLAKGRTAFFISHRFSTVRMADRIFVLDEGKIIESGTHEELIKNKNKYAGLFELQAQYYR